MTSKRRTRGMIKQRSENNHGRRLGRTGGGEKGGGMKQKMG